MNQLRLLISILVVALLLSLTQQARAESSEFRLASNDPEQEKRTTSINWPATSKTEVSPNDIASVEAPAAPPAVKRFRVLVDVGHGGIDLGAPGIGISEKDVCLKIAAFVKTRLERMANLYDFPVEVRLSRESDHFIPLRERVRLANQWSADLFISIHANSSPVSRARGFEVYFLSNEASDADAIRVARQENAEAASAPVSKGILSILSDLRTNHHILESSRFAESVYGSLSERLRPNGKGVRQAPFTVLSGTQMPALLIEVGYVTNANEAESLAKPTYQQRIASGISEGVLSFALQMRRISRSLYRGNKRTT